MKNKKIFLLLLIVFFFINVYDFLVIFIFQNHKFIIYLLFFIIFIILTVPFLKKEYLYKIIYRYVNSDKTEKSDYKYYRDLIVNYPIGAIFECYGAKINKYDQLVIRLLKLLLTKKIEYKNNNIIILNTDNLYPSEKMFIKAFQGYSIFTKENLREQLNEDNYNDAIATELFCKEKRLGKDKTYITVIIFFIFIHLWNTLLLYRFAFFVDVVLYLYVIYGLTLLAFFARIKTDQILFRTDKGNEVKNKLNGLKNYLDDFSIIDERSLKEIKIWDEYMIYAIIFNKKGTLDNETYLLYKKIIKKIVK